MVDFVIEGHVMRMHVFLLGIPVETFRLLSPMFIHSTPFWQL